MKSLTLLLDIIWNTPDIKHIVTANKDLPKLPCALIIDVLLCVRQLHTHDVLLAFCDVANSRCGLGPQISHH